MNAYNIQDMLSFVCSTGVEMNNGMSQCYKHIWGSFIVI